MIRVLSDKSKIHIGLIAGLALSVTNACTTQFGAHNVAPGAYDYNRSLALSQDQQLLLNLVRLRYRDTVMFLDIASITTQHSYSGAASLGSAFPFGGISGGNASPSTGLSYSETPTISYVPLKGEDFASKMLAPIPVQTLFLLAGSGWSIERLLLCCVEQFGPLSNGPSASGPTPVSVPDNRRFRVVASLLRQLQSEEKAIVELDTSNGKSDVYLRFRVPRDALSLELKSILNLPANAERLLLGGKPSNGDLATLSSRSRSLLGALYALSHTIDIPFEHQDAGFVTSSHNTAGNTGDWEHFLGGLFDVKTSSEDPGAVFVKVKYRGHWFWIPNDDLNAKTSFSLLNFLLALQSAGGQGKAPLLTISAAAGG